MKKKKKEKLLFEDLLSGKGISYIYSVLSQNIHHTYSNEDILNNIKNDKFCSETKIVWWKFMLILQNTGL